MTSTTAPDLAGRAAAAIAAGELQHRSVALRAAAPPEADAEAREIDGIGVPYGEVIEHLFGREAFDPGSITDAESARLLWQHGQPIGRVTASADTDAALTITAKVSQTVLGDEALTLVRDGVVTGLSIGFEPLEYRVETDDAGVETIHWTKVRAREFSLVTFPAYESATTTAVRSAAGGSTTRKEHPMPDTPAGVLTRADLDPITEQLADLGRAVELVGTPSERDSLAAEARQWRSMGEFVQALAAGDETASTFYTRAFAGGVTADVEPVADLDGTGGWLGTYVRQVLERRRTINLFSTGPLPSQGMRVSYASLAGDTLQVGKQPAEGENLPGPGKLTFVNDSDPVETYGGWTELSRQVIERESVSYLDTVWTAFGIKYAAETDAAVRNRLAAETAALIAQGGDSVLTLPANPTPYDYLDAIVDGAEVYETRGFNLAGLMVDKAEFKRIARTTANDGRPIMSVYGQGVNTVGEVNVPDGMGSLAKVPVNILWGATPGTRFFYDPVAVRTLEAPGAPFRLQDDNIVNLTRAFSLYGYMAVTVPFPSAIVPIVGAGSGE